MNRKKLTFLAGQVGHVSDSLHSFAEARFVCQNSIEVFLVQVDEPVHTNLLIVSQRATQKERCCTSSLVGWKGHLNSVKRIHVLLSLVDTSASR